MKNFHKSIEEIILHYKVESIRPTKVRWLKFSYLKELRLNLEEIQDFKKRTFYIEYQMSIISKNINELKFDIDTLEYDIGNEMALALKSVYNELDSIRRGYYRQIANKEDLLPNRIFKKENHWEEFITLLRVRGYLTDDNKWTSELNNRKEIKGLISALSESGLLRTSKKTQIFRILGEEFEWSYSKPHGIPSEIDLKEFENILSYLN